MGHKFADLMFTPAVQEVQSELGSRDGFSSWDARPDFHHRIDHAVAAFIAERDSFYMASVTETDWPYLQHRGGPKGFLKIIDDKTLGFADYSGNRQYISTGNFKNNDRVALFFMDYANRRRLKMLGRVKAIPLNDHETLDKLESDDYRANVERGFIIELEAYDWNCPQHITPRFDEAQIDEIVAPLLDENKRLKTELTRITNVNIKQADALTLQSSSPVDQWEPSQDSLEKANLASDDLSSDNLSPDNPSSNLLSSDTQSNHIHRKNNGSKKITLSLVISGIRQLTPTIRTYELGSADGSALPACEPGAHLEIPINMPDGSSTIRRYSIHNDPTHNNRYEFAVLKEDSGKGGSHAIHQTFTLGMPVNVPAPQNYFALDKRLLKDNPTYSPIIFLAAGIGITPLKAMATALHKLSLPFHLHYAGKERGKMAFAEELEKTFKTQVSLYESERHNRMPLQQLLQNAQPSTQFYSCGPTSFLEEIKHHFKKLNLNAANLHFEQFSASQGDDNKPFSVELARSGIVIDVAANESMLEALETAGISIPNSCRTGSCRTCAIPLISGDVDHKDSALTKEEQSATLCPCVSRGRTQISVEL